MLGSSRFVSSNSIMSELKCVMQSCTTTTPFGYETGVEELQTNALYASNFAGENSLVLSLPLSILLFNSGNNFSFTKTIVLFLTPPVVLNMYTPHMPQPVHLHLDCYDIEYIYFCTLIADLKNPFAHAS